MELENIKNFVRLCKRHNKNEMVNISRETFGNDWENVLDYVYSNLYNTQIKGGGILDNIKHYFGLKSDIIKLYNIIESKDKNKNININEYYIDFDKLSEKPYFNKVLHIFILSYYKMPQDSDINSYLSNNIDENMNTFAIEYITQIKSLQMNIKETNIINKTNKTRTVDSKILFDNIFCESLFNSQNNNELNKCLQNIENIKTVNFDYNNIQTRDIFILFMFKNNEKNNKYIDMFVSTIVNGNLNDHLDNVLALFNFYNDLNTIFKYQDEELNIFNKIYTYKNTLNKCNKDINLVINNLEHVIVQAKKLLENIKPTT